METVLSTLELTVENQNKSVKISQQTQRRTRRGLKSCMNYSVNYEIE